MNASLGVASESVIGTDQAAGDSDGEVIRPDATEARRSLRVQGDEPSVPPRVAWG